MLRRGFLKSTMALLGGAMFTGQVAGGPVKRSVLLQHSPVAGLQYYEGERLWSGLRPGQSVRLIREPDNPFDGNAIRIEFDGQKLGYVPRRENVTLAQLLDRDQVVVANLVGKSNDTANWRELRVAISLIV